MCGFARKLLLAATALSYLICVLFLSGMQKEDLEVGLLKKLEQHNVNIDDVSDQQLRDNCATKVNMAAFNGMQTTGTEGTASTTQGSNTSNQKNTQAKDLSKLLEGTDFETILKYFKNKQAIPMSISILENTNIFKASPPPKMGTEGNFVEIKNNKVERNTRESERKHEKKRTYKDMEQTIKIDNFIKLWQIYDSKTKNIEVVTEPPKLNYNKIIRNKKTTTPNIDHSDHTQSIFYDMITTSTPDGEKNQNSKEIEQMGKLLAQFIYKKQNLTTKKPKLNIWKQINKLLDNKPEELRQSQETEQVHSTKIVDMVKTQEGNKIQFQLLLDNLKELTDITNNNKQEDSNLGKYLDLQELKNRINNGHKVSNINNLLKNNFYLRTINKNVDEENLNVVPETKEHEYVINTSEKSNNLETIEAFTNRINNYAADSRPIEKPTQDENLKQKESKDSISYQKKSVGKREEYKSRGEKEITYVLPPQSIATETSSNNHLPNRTDEIKELPKDMIKEIAESIKTMVLNDIRKEISSTTITSTVKTTTENNFNLVTSTDIPQNITTITMQQLSHNVTSAIEKFMELYEQIKSMKENKITPREKEYAVTEKISMKHEFSLPMIYPQHLPVYGLPGVHHMEVISNFGMPQTHIAAVPYIIKPTLHHSITKQQINITYPHNRAPIIHINQLHPSPIMIQTNSAEIPPLGIPLVKPESFSILLTTEPSLDFIKTKADRDRWNYMYRYSRNPDKRNELHNVRERLDAYANSNDNIKKHVDLNEDINNDFNKRLLQFRSHEEPSYAQSKHDIRGFHEKLENVEKLTQNSKEYLKNIEAREKEFESLSPRFQEPKFGKLSHDPKKVYNIETREKEYDKFASMFQVPNVGKLAHNFKEYARDIEEKQKEYDASRFQEFKMGALSHNINNIEARERNDPIATKFHEPNIMGSRDSKELLKKIEAREKEYDRLASRYQAQKIPKFTRNSKEHKNIEKEFDKYASSRFREPEIGKLTKEHFDKDETYDKFSSKFHEPKLGKQYYVSKEYQDTEARDKDYDRFASRYQEPLGGKKKSRYDDKHFQNFLKTQQKVNDMLERILATKTRHELPSVETI